MELMSIIIEANNFIVEKCRSHCIKIFEAALENLKISLKNLENLNKESYLMGLF